MTDCLTQPHADPWLSDDQLARFTGYERPTDQMAELAKSGIPFHVMRGRPRVMVNDMSAMPQSNARPKVKKLA